MIAAFWVRQGADQPVLVAPPRGAERPIGEMNNATIARKEAARRNGGNLPSRLDAVLQGQTINSFVALSVMSG